MLEIVQVEDPDKNSIAPTVYVKSVDLTDNNIAVTYYLDDGIDPSTGKKYWSDDVDVLNNFKIYLSCNGKEATRGISGIVQKDKTRYEDTIIIQRSASATEERKLALYYSLTASCNSDTITGITTIEPVLESGSAARSDSLLYVSKVRDLTILNPQILSASYVKNVNPVITGSLMVSYTTNKKGKAGLIFDLDAYLQQNSTNYKILNNYKKFANLSLQNSYIDTSLSSVYRKDITNRDESYIKINSPIQTLKFDDLSGSYLVTFTDPNIDNSTHEYDVKVNLSVSDYSQVFFDTHILQRLSYIKSFIHGYKNDLAAIYADKNIENGNEYYYTYNYDVIYDFVDRSGPASKLPLYEIFAKISLEIAETTSIFCDIQIDHLSSLYCSILHPLSTKIELLDGLLNHIDTLTSVAKQFSRVDKIETLEQANLTKHNKAYEKIFKKALDYRYARNVGFEVISTDNIVNRNSDESNGLLILTDAEKTARKYIETSKYFANPSTVTRNNINTFSINTFDIYNESYDLSQIGNTDLSPYNDILIRLNNLKDTANKSVQSVDYGFQYDFNKYGYILDQLGVDGVCIETISNRANSANSLIQNTVYDPNNSTRDISLQFIADTNVLGLYLNLDKHEFKKPEGQTNTQDIAALDPSNSQNPKFPVTDSVLNNVEAKTKLIFYYNQLFTDTVVKEGTNYSIYHMSPTEDRQNNLFDKIAHFNSYYVMQTKEPENYSRLVYDPKITEEMMSGDRPEYLNRNTQESKLGITVEDI